MDRCPTLKHLCEINFNLVGWGAFLVFLHKLFIILALVESSFAESIVAIDACPLKMLEGHWLEIAEGCEPRRTSGRCSVSNNGELDALSECFVVIAFVRGFESVALEVLDNLGRL